MNKIVGLLQINKLNTRNIIKVCCENNHSSIRYAKKECKNCKKFACKFCVKNDRTKCIMCSEINKRKCELCKHEIRKNICHLCGDIIIRCNYYCINNMEIFCIHCGNRYFARCRNCEFYDKKCNACNKN